MMKYMKNKEKIDIENIIESKKCLGCGACANMCNLDALHMRIDEKGFVYPRVDNNKCIHCNNCFLVCPAVSEHVMRVKHDVKNNNVYSARIKDDEIRRKSSSGGMFYVLSNYILSNGGYVCGVVWNDDFSVKHICSNCVSDRDAMMLSKYIQSDTSSTYSEVRQHLLDGDLVLFTGTPCQCAALQLFLNHINTEKLFVMDVLCGGNVSPGFFKEYIKYIENLKKDKAKSVCFRTKKLGWKQHHLKVELEHSVYEGARRDDEPFFSLYLGKQIIRDSCFSCGFATIERVSDITVGDFWGLNDPIIDDDRGISLVMLNTKKGKYIFDKISEQINFELRNIEIAVARQINLRSAPLKPSNRECFWNDWRHCGAEYALRKYTVFGRRNYIKRKMIRFLRQVRG